MKKHSGREAAIAASIGLAVLAFSGWHQVFAVPIDASVDDLASPALFAVDSEADPSSKRPEFLHPRLSLRSVAGVVEPDSADPTHSVIKLTFYAFKFTQADRAAARRGDIPSLEKKYHAVQSTNSQSPEFNGGGWASVQLTVDQHRKLQRVLINIPGYAIVLEDRDLTDFAQEYQFDGKSLRLKSKGQHRLDLTSARVDSFTMHWDVDLNTQVVKASPLGKGAR